MKLRACRTEKGQTQAVAAAEVGVTQGAWHRYELGLRIPEDDVMRRIFDWSDGRVTPNDIYELGHDEAVEPAANSSEAAA